MGRLLLVAPRYTYFASLSWGGDTPTGELEAEVSFSVAWGSDPSPATLDPGGPDEVEDIRVEKIDGKPAAEYDAHDYIAGETVRQIIDKLEMDHEEEMIRAAADEADAREADGAVWAAEETREVERTFGTIEDDA